ncbi:MAG: hypothetical protein ABI988_19040 [Nitrospirota bacterium]
MCRCGADSCLWWPGWTGTAGTCWPGRCRARRRRGSALEAVDQALASGQSQIFNTDQGAQFIGVAFTRRLAEAKILISIDTRGRARDNIFVERLWRSVTY